MAPPLYSSNSSSWLASSLVCLLGVVSVCVTFHLHLVESDGRLVGTVEGAREHAPNEEAERTNAHQHGACIRSGDLETLHDSVSLGGGWSGGAECRGLLRRALARNIGILRRIRLEVEIVQRRAIGVRDRQRLSRERVLIGGKRENVVGKCPPVFIGK